MGQPSGVSLLCLSCHDGTVAASNYGGTGDNSEYVTGTANLGTDLSNDHPISIDWEHQTLETDALCTNCHFTSNPVPFFNGRVECASCHDVHDGTPYEKLLRLGISGSPLCLHCHEK